MSPFLHKLLLIMVILPSNSYLKTACTRLYTMDLPLRSFGTAVTVVSGDVGAGNQTSLELLKEQLVLLPNGALSLHHSVSVQSSVKRYLVCLRFSVLVSSAAIACVQLSLCAALESGSTPKVHAVGHKTVL